MITHGTGPKNTTLKRSHECARWTRRYGGIALAASIPFGIYVNEPARRNFQRMGYRTQVDMPATTVPDDAIRMAAEAAGAPFFSATDAFRQQSANPKLHFDLDLHLTAEGHAFYADCITPWVADQVRAALQRGTK